MRLMFDDGTKELAVNVILDILINKNSDLVY